MEYHDLLIKDVVRMLCARLVHGDLSEFNILVDAHGPVIIDYESGSLTPDVKLTGHFKGSNKEADLDSIMREINDARDEAILPQWQSPDFLHRAVADAQRRPSPIMPPYRIESSG